MTHLSEVEPSTLSQEELQWLDKFCQWDYDGRKLEHLLTEVVKDELKLWRLSASPARGLVGTRLLVKPNGRQLWLELLVGQGLLREASSIRSAILERGRLANCNSLAGVAVRPGLAKLYETILGVKPSATLFREDL